MVCGASNGADYIPKMKRGWGCGASDEANYIPKGEGGGKGMGCCPALGWLVGLVRPLPSGVGCVVSCHWSLQLGMVCEGAQVWCGGTGLLGVLWIAQVD